MKVSMEVLGNTEKKKGKGGKEHEESFSTFFQRINIIDTQVLTAIRRAASN